MWWIVLVAFAGFILCGLISVRINYKRLYFDPKLAVDKIGEKKRDEEIIGSLFCAFFFWWAIVIAMPLSWFVNGGVRKEKKRRDRVAAEERQKTALASIDGTIDPEIADWEPPKGVS